MPPENSQESEVTQVTQTANEASSPDATNGASSSDAAAGKSIDAELLRDAFVKEWGDPAKEDDEDTLSASDEDDQQDDEADEADDSTSPKAEQKQPDNQADDGDDEHRLSDEDFKALPEGARKRIGSLNTKLRKAEKVIQEYETKTSTYEDSHQRWTQFNEVIKANNVTPNDVAQAVEILGLVSSGDMEGFLKAIGPYVEVAELAVGRRLPPDLQAKVEDGYLSQEDAAEIARSRFLAARSQQQVQRFTQREQQQSQQQAHQATVQKIVSAVHAREEELKSSDPDYARLEPQVKRQIQYAIENGARPQSPEQAIKMVNDAYASVREMSARRPEPPKSTPRRPSATSAARGHSQPKTFADAVKQAALDAQSW